ncbi:MAG: hypothetical protein ACLR78_01015 [Roseburia sp.]
MYVDGKETEPETFAEAFISVPLTDGKHDIELILYNTRTEDWRHDQSWLSRCFSCSLPFGEENRKRILLYRKACVKISLSLQN